jgi:hypothetical protein
VGRVGYPTPPSYIHGIIIIKVMTQVNKNTIKSIKLDIIEDYQRFYGNDYIDFILMDYKVSFDNFYSIDKLFNYENMDLIEPAIEELVSDLKKK